MPGERLSSHDPVAAARSSRIDKARLLRDATLMFLAEPESNRVAARQYASLAAGFLPQIDRGAALDIARLISQRSELGADIHAAFHAVGIRFRAGLAPDAPMPTDFTPTRTPAAETSPMATTRFFDDPTVAQTAAAAPYDGHAHLDPYRLRLPPLNAVTVLAIARAADRNDLEDAATILAAVLNSHGLRASTDAVSRLLCDPAGEPAALLVAALGGDRNLLTRILYTFCTEKRDLAGRCRQTLQFFETITAEASAQLIARYFSAPVRAGQENAPVRPRGPAAQHVTVQSGQSLLLRATGTAQKPAVKPALSQRLDAAMRAAGKPSQG